MNQKKIEFMYQAINDTQGTIRAIDVKLGFLFVVIFMPLTAVVEISKSISVLWESNYHYGIIVILVALAWLLSVFFLFLGLSPILAVNNHISTIQSPVTEAFFSGGIPFIKRRDSISVKHIRASKTLKEYVESIPDSEDAIINELAYEKMKISFIRNVKSIRTTMCTYATLVWLLFGTFLSVVYLLHWGC